MSVVLRSPIQGSTPITLKSTSFPSQGAKRFHWNENHISYRIYHSPLLRLLLAVGVATMSATKLGAQLQASVITIASIHFSPALIVGIGFFSAGLIIFLACRHLRKNLSRYWYELSLTMMVVLNKVFKDRWAMYSRIDTHLILSALPLKNMNHHTTFVKKERVGAIVSIVNRFELDYVGMASVPVRKMDWKILGVEQHHREVEDLHPVSIPIIEEAVKFIHDNRGRGITSAVHCKAGRGRSATIVICYLLKHRKELWEHHQGKDDVTKAFYFVKRIRHIALTPDQMKQIHLFHSGTRPLGISAN